MILACTVNGMPLVYSGQEIGLDRSLKFFDKDEIQCKNHRFAEIYTKLFLLKHQNNALWNGQHGGEMIRIFNDKPEQVISFSPEKEGQRVIPIINYSKTPAVVRLKAEMQSGTYKELFSGKEFVLNGEKEVVLAPWQYMVLVQ